MKKYTITLDSAEITCKPNSILSSRIFEYLRANGHSIQTNIRETDYIIINTCGFDRTRENLSHRLFRQHHLKKPARTKIISVGCLNRINRDGLERTFPGIHFIDDLNDLDAIFYNRVKFSGLEQAALDPQTINSLALNATKGFDLIEKIYLSAAGTVNDLHKP